jgi:hypothetical protein
MTDPIQLPSLGPALNLVEPCRQMIRLGLNLWAQSLEDRWDLCRKVVDTVSNVFAPESEERRGLWEANRELLRFVTDRPFELEREVLSLCQSATSEPERGLPAHHRATSRRNEAASAPKPEAKPSTSTGGAVPPETKPLQIQTPIGLERPVVVPIRMRNHNNRPSQVRLSATPFVDERGRPVTAPLMRFHPADVSLPGPGSFDAAGLIDTRSGFEPNRVYRADIVLEGDPAMRIPFYIRTLPPMPQQIPGFTAELVGPPGLSRAHEGT